MAVFYKAPTVSEESVGPNTSYLNLGNTLVDAASESYLVQFVTTYWPGIVVLFLLTGLILARALAVRHSRASGVLADEQPETPLDGGAAQIGGQILS